MTDIERLVVGWIKGFNKYPVSTMRPKNPPNKYITIERTGGLYNAWYKVQSPTVAIQCWGNSSADVTKMAYEVSDYLTTTYFDPHVAGLEIDSMYYFPSADDIPRYQIILSFDYQED